MFSLYVAVHHVFSELNLPLSKWHLNWSKYCFKSGVHTTLQIRTALFMFWGLNLCSGKSNQGRTVTPFWVESLHLCLLIVTVEPILLALQSVFGSLHSSGEDGKAIAACPLQVGLLNLRKGQGCKELPFTWRRIMKQSLCGGSRHGSSCRLQLRKLRWTGRSSFLLHKDVNSV